MAVHAAVQYAVDYPHLAKAWQDSSNSIVLLSVADESELMKYYTSASCLTGVSLFKEPDIGNEATSFACVLPREYQPLFKKLSLLLRGGDV